MITDKKNWSINTFGLIRRHNKSRKLRCLRVCAISQVKGFHESRFAVRENREAKSQGPLQLTVRQASTDEELLAASHLRAVTFFAYPPERAFAGQLHQQQVRQEEFEALTRNREKQKGNPGSRERSATLIVLCPGSKLPAAHRYLRVSALENSSQASEDEVVVGNLDVHAIRSLPGEVLIGNSQNAAYLANVCVLEAAQRRGVGGLLIQEAKNLAQSWNADGLFVHMMAVNEVARRFYEGLGFVLEKEESSNEAHYRGRCLDGVEGLGRSILLKDTLL